MTMLLRLVLIPYVIMSIFFMAVPYAKQIELFAQPIAILKKATAENNVEVEELNDKAQIDVMDAIDVIDVINTNDTNDLTFTFNNRPFLIPVDEEGQIKWLDKLIAGFIYHFETYPKSACKKSSLQRSLPIDENLILLVVEDNSALGYQFSVGPCVGNYSDVENPPQ